MTDKTFDLAKAMANGGKCRTREGAPARIICTDLAGDDPIIALVREGDLESVETYRKDGRYLPSGGESDFDLINIPERHVRWVNVYPEGVAMGYASREMADKVAARNRIACIRIECEEGEGL